MITFMMIIEHFSISMLLGLFYLQPSPSFLHPLKTNYLIKKKMKHPNQKAIVHASWFLLEAN